MRVYAGIDGWHEEAFWVKDDRNFYAGWWRVLQGQRHCFFRQDDKPQKKQVARQASS